jgi:SAM-dependent methyltransferase
MGSSELVVCPGCGARAAQKKAELSRGDALFACDGCTHHFLRESEPASAAAIYDHEYHGYRDDPVFGAAVNRFIDEDLRPRLCPPARVLDLGCGGGAFLHALRDAGYSARGLDASEAAIAMCRSRGLDAAVGDFRDDRVADEYKGVELVTLWDVIEHLFDPAAFMRQIARILRPGGLVYVKTPGIGWLSLEATRRVPRLAGSLVAAPAHNQFFREASLSALLLRCGFEAPEWLPPRAVRATATSGSIKKRLARAVVKTIQRASGDHNLLVFAHT